jgi:hypothetical protein
MKFQFIATIHPSSGAQRANGNAYLHVDRCMGILQFGLLLSFLIRHPCSLMCFAFDREKKTEVRPVLLDGSENFVLNVGEGKCPLKFVALPNRLRKASENGHH